MRQTTCERPIATVQKFIEIVRYLIHKVSLLAASTILVKRDFHYCHSRVSKYVKIGTLKRMALHPYPI